MTSTTAPRTGRTWKATVAVGAAVALLAAGGATFAEWSVVEDLGNDAAKIQSGSLALSADEAGTWTNVTDEDVTAAVEGGTYHIVPGDALTYSEQVTIEATGDLLAATVSTNIAKLSGDEELLGALAKDASMTLNGAALEELSALVEVTGEEQKLDVSLTITFDEKTAGQLAQGKTADLGALQVTLEQNSVTAEG